MVFFNFQSEWQFSRLLEMKYQSPSPISNARDTQTERKPESRVAPFARSMRAHTLQSEKKLSEHVPPKPPAFANDLDGFKESLRATVDGAR